MSQQPLVERLPGLSGGSYKYTLCGQSWVLRRHPIVTFSVVSRVREYRLLRKINNSGITATPSALTREGIIQPWIPGTILSPTEFHPENVQLMQLLLTLYQLPLSGYPISISTLLRRYWQLCHEKTYARFRLLKRLLKRGIPAPIRTTLLHMDLHAGNIIQQHQKYFLIDWEYAGDGDIALELTTLCWQQPLLAKQWISLYAKQWHIPEPILEAQMRRWRPWIGLLHTFWYQLRYQQTGEEVFKQWAKESFIQCEY